MQRKWKYYKIRYLHKLHQLKRNISQPMTIVMMVIAIVCIVAYILWQSLTSSLYQDKYRIHKTLFTTGTIDTYNDIDLFGKIIDIYSGNYYSTARIDQNISKRLKKLVSQSAHVQKIETLSFLSGNVVVNVVYNKPLFTVLYNSNSYAIYQDKSFYLLTGNDQLGLGVPQINLPLYLSGTSESLSGFLYTMSVDKLLQDYLLLKTAPIQGSISYLPGAEKYIIRRPEIMISFNAKKDLVPQLQTLLTLKNNYHGFEVLREIDVGSLKDPIIR